MDLSLEMAKSRSFISAVLSMGPVPFSWLCPPASSPSHLGACSLRALEFASPVYMPEVCALRVFLSPLHPLSYVSCLICSLHFYLSKPHLLFKAQLKCHCIHHLTAMVGL